MLELRRPAATSSAAPHAAIDDEQVENKTNRIISIESKQSSRAVLLNMESPSVATIRVLLSFLERQSQPIVLA